MRDGQEHWRELLSELGDEAGVDLAPSPHGVVTVVFDGVTVSIENPDNSPFVYFHSPIRRLGADRARELEAAMRANLFGLPLSGAWLALDGTSDELFLCYSAQSAQLTSASMLALMEAVAASVGELREAELGAGKAAPADHDFAAELNFIRI